MKMGFPNIRQSGGIGTRFIIFNSLSRIFLSLRDVDWTHTVAYSKGNYAQIYINLRGREPNGIVSPGEEYLSVRQRIVEKLKNLKIEENGNSFVGEIYTKDEIYQGIFNSVAPDIFLLPGDPSFKALGTMDFIGNKFIIDNYAQSGDHRMQGIFVACGPGIKYGGNCESARLIDIHPTVLRLLDLGISSDLDGKPLEEIFTDDFLEKTCVKKIDPINKPSGSLEPKDELNHEDQKGIKKLLKGFGYIG
jgi:predicted AlkP superfamily phosphohydrolase/phosphomutase